MHYPHELSSSEESTGRALSAIGSSAHRFGPTALACLSTVRERTRRQSAPDTVDAPPDALAALPTLALVVVAEESTFLERPCCCAPNQH